MTGAGAAAGAGGGGAWQGCKAYLSCCVLLLVLPAVAKAPQTPVLFAASKEMRLDSAFRLAGRAPIKALLLRFRLVMAAMPLPEPHGGMVPLSCTGVSSQTLMLS